MKAANIIRIIVFVFLIAGIATAVAYRKQFNFAALEGWLASAGVMAPLLFIGIYAISTVLFLPGAVLTIAGGVLFGPVWGTFYNLTGATIGATMAFLIARYLASDLVSRKIGGRLKQLVEGVEAEGWRFVAFARLVPLFPFNLLNYIPIFMPNNKWKLIFDYIITLNIIYRMFMATIKFIFYFDNVKGSIDLVE